MGKKIYIDGNFLLKSGVFYGLHFCCYADESFKNVANECIIPNENGIYEVAEDGGSMFNTYYVKGGITMFGGNGSSIVYFKNVRIQNIRIYKIKLLSYLKKL